MKFEDLYYLKEFGADLDPDKKRFEINLLSPEGKENHIIGYYPSESIQIIVRDIHQKNIPDFGLKFGGTGRYLRINFCKEGKCEFQGKNGESLYLSAGEIVMDYKIDDDGSFSFVTEDYLGLEIIMQVDKVILDIPTLAMLKKAIKRMDMPAYATSINTLYFVAASDDTIRTLGELLKYCFENYDCEAIIIKTAELGHNIGTDLTTSKAKIRTFATSMQAKIAVDVYQKLTDEYGKKWPVSIFAEKYGLSETTIKNYFRNVYGYSYKEYQKKVRMEKAADLLIHTKLHIDEIAMRVRYLSATKFGSVFKDYYDSTPSEYRLHNRIKLLDDNKQN